MSHHSSSGVGSSNRPSSSYLFKFKTPWPFRSGIFDEPLYSHATPSVVEVSNSSDYEAIGASGTERSRISLVLVVRPSHKRKRNIRRVTSLEGY